MAGGKVNMFQLPFQEINATYKFPVGSGVGEVHALDTDEMHAALQISEAHTAAGAIDLDADYVSLSVASGTYAVTLAAPAAAQYGRVKVIEMIDATGTSVTMSLANVVGGTAATTATFNAVDETLVLVGSAAGWIVLKEHGVTLS